MTQKPEKETSPRALAGAAAGVALFVGVLWVLYQGWDIAEGVKRNLKRLEKRGFEL